MSAKVAAADSGPSVVAFAAASGKQLWVHATPFVGPTLGFTGGQLVYVMGLTSCGQGRVVIALDAKTGNERWRAPADSFGRSTGRGVLVVSSHQGVHGLVRGLDALTGKARWESASDTGLAWIETGDVVVVFEHRARNTSALADHATVLDRKTGVVQKIMPWSFVLPPVVAVNDILVNSTQPRPYAERNLGHRRHDKVVDALRRNLRRHQLSRSRGCPRNPRFQDRSWHRRGVGTRTWRVTGDTATNGKFLRFEASAPHSLVANWWDGNNGTIDGLDPATGRVLWKHAYGKAANPQVGPDLVAVIGHVYGADDGRQRWRLPAGFTPQLVTSTLVLTTTTDFSNDCPS